MEEILRKCIIHFVISLLKRNDRRGLCAVIDVPYREGFILS